MIKFRELTPYVPGEQFNDSNFIKLNTNENPYPPSPAVDEAIKNFDYKKLNLYPQTDPYDLIDLIAKANSLKSEQVFVGNGSDEVLALSFLAFFNSDYDLLMPDVSYSFYKVWAQLFKTKVKLIKLDNDFRINKEDYLIENGGIIIANPNAPTSIYENLDFIEFILKNNQDSIVLIDEAYIDFAGESASKLIDEYEHLIVVRTYSKSLSLAGIRVGYALASKKLINVLNAVKNSFNSYPLDALSIKIASSAISDMDYYNKINKKIIDTRDKYIEKLALLGFKSLESSANFIFTEHDTVPAKEIYEKLKEKNILLRYFSQDRIDNHLRISIGTDDEMKILYDNLESLLSKKLK